MMRTIKIPYRAVQQAIAEGCCVVTVELDWPELCLSDEEAMTNEWARAQGQDPPFLDRRFVNVEIEGHDA